MAYVQNAFLTGMALRIFVEGLARKQAKNPPIAYSYNGVVLPELPEWDRERYPYAYLTTIWVRPFRVQFFATTDPLGITADTAGPWITTAGKKTPFISFEIRVHSDGNWSTDCGNWMEYACIISSQTTHEPFWTNTDMEQYTHDADYVYTATGEIGFAASEPIPVYE